MSKPPIAPVAKRAADVAEIRRALDLLTVPGGVVEIRALKVPGRSKPSTAAGYFTDLDLAAEAAAALDARKPAGVYVVLNEINSALLARSPEQVTDYLDQTTSDGDITRRRWLPLDFDPKRPSGVSSTDAEHAAAEAVARECADWLRNDGGWPEPIIADSGNGWHLLYRVDLPNDDDARGVVQAAIAAVGERFTGRGVDVDRSVFNAARIWKLYATTARKGYSMPDRPHRVARLVEVPQQIQVVPIAKLRALAGRLSKPELPRISTGGNGQCESRLDVARWLTDRGVSFRVKDRPDNMGRTVYLLEKCPFNEVHGGHGETAIYQAADGKLGAACKHNSCTGRGWSEFKERIGKPDGDHYDPPLWNGKAKREYPRAPEASDNGHQEAGPAANPAQVTKSPPAFVRLLTGAELLALDLKPRFLVRGVMVEGQPMIVGGRCKTLKTSVACDLAVSLGSGTPFLGRFESQRVGVGFWSGESGAATIRETARRIAESKGGVSLADVDCLWCFDLPRLSRLNHLDHLAKVIRGEGLRVAILDPLYLALLSPETASGASNVFLMGAMLQGLTKLGQDTGCTVVLLHHFRKGGQPDEENPAGLEELSQSGVAEWARQWVLLQRRTAYQADGVHHLWMRCGGSAGHSSLLGVTIDEGIIDPETFEGRKWDVTTSPAADARAEAERDKANRKAAEQEKREGEHRERLLVVLLQAPEGDTAKALREAAGLNSANFGKAVSALLQEGRATRCKVVKNKREEDGFKSTGK